MQIKNISQSIFLEVMGDSPVNRDLNFLDFNDEYDYSLADIAHHSSVGYSTLQLFWKKLEKHRLVVQTRKVGKAKMYKLNKQNPIIKNFQKMAFELCKKQSGKLEKKVLVFS